MCLTAHVEKLKKIQNLLVPCGLTLWAALGALVGTSMGLVFGGAALTPMAISFLGLGIFYFGRHMSWSAGWGIFLMVLGFFATWADSHINTLENQTLPQSWDGGRFWVVGQVTEVKREEQRDRIKLEDVTIFGKSGHMLLGKVRLATNQGRFKNFSPGDWMAAESILFAPRAPLFEGDFDGHRWALTSGIGATGMVRGGIYTTPGPPGEIRKGFSFTIALNHFREGIAQKIYAEKTAAHGVAAALLTGVRDFIPEKVWADVRATGLAHLLAISGLHLGLVAGTLFFGVRALLALWPAIPLRFNTKKGAALVALSGVGFYMLLAGASIPTVRAFLMLLALFTAVLLGRIRLGLRVLCLTAIIVLLIWPESILTASFQMSFAATLALLLWAGVHEQVPKSRLKLVQGIDYFKVVWACSVVAGLATLPLAAFHFQQVSLVGFLLNLAAIPLTAFWILPLGMLVLLFIPLPFDVYEAPLWAMAQGIELFLLLADWGQSLPFAGVFISPEWSGGIMLAALLVLLTYLLFSWRWILVSIILFCGLIWSVSKIRPFDLMVFKSGAVFMAQGSNLLNLTEGKEANHIAQRVAKRYGLNLAASKGGNCDSVGCVYRVGAKKILVENSGYSITPEDCRLVDTIFSEHIFCSNVFTMEKGAKSLRIWFEEEQIQTQAFF